MNQPDVMILDNVSKAFGEDWERETVVEKLSLTVKRNQLTAIVGPSGCGKSTIVNLLAGFELPDEGTITLDGKPVTGPSKNSLVVFQETALMPWLTTYQNVVFGPQLRGDMPTNELKAAAGKIIETVGLREFRDKYPLQLSGGMQKRISLARTIATDPEIIFFDEPTTVLDPIMSDVINELVIRVREETGATTITITHDMHSVRRIGGDCAMIYEGEFIWQGHIDDIDSSGNGHVDQFINGSFEGPI